jgi:hypothetical protein
MALFPNQTNLIQQFFSPTEPESTNSKIKKNSVVRGSLVNFSYAFWKNDPNPLVIIIDNNPASDKIAGINIHRLTFPSIRNLIKKTYQFGFSYNSISADSNFRKAYRTYKRTGVKQIKILDTEMLLKVMNMVRTYDPAEVEIIRKQVQEQIRQQINPKADQIATLNSETGG